MSVEPTSDDSGAPAFVITLRADAKMECGKTYEVAVVPTNGAIDIGAIDQALLKSVVSEFVGCRLAYMQMTSAECIVRWRCHNKCPHVAEHNVYAAANAIAGVIATPTNPMEISRVGMVWVQSNKLYLAGGLLFVGVGALGAACLARLKASRNK